jgi:hypothetical protein
VSEEIAVWRFTGKNYDGRCRRSLAGRTSVVKRIHSVAGSLDNSTMDEIDDALKLSLGLN